MAGDWIKMRDELSTHPKFISLCNELMFPSDDDEIGIFVYACTEDTLEIGVLPPSKLCVTDRALRYITRPALRDVTMCALLRVWCSVNSHCSVAENDAVMTPMSVLDVDVIAGFSGFGQAMKNVGWILEKKRNVLIFPNFLEFNDPACTRRKVKTNAERQADWRRKQAEKKEVEKAVTKSNESNAREEKRREDKEEERRTRQKHSDPDVKTRFDQFWKLYPNKVSKGEAMKAWMAVKPDAELFERMRVAIEKQKHSRKWMKNDGEFIPNPATWIRGLCWEDEQPVAPAHDPEDWGPLEAKQREQTTKPNPTSESIMQ